MDPTFLVQQILHGLSFGALLFLMASGFTLVFGLMRISNLAHGSFYLVGAYIAVATVGLTGSFWIGVAAGVGATALTGLITETALLRRVRGQEMPEVLLTVGVLFVLTDLMLMVFGGGPVSLPAGSGAPSGSLIIGSFAYPWYRLFVIGITALVAIALFLLQRYSKIGAIVRAGVDDRQIVEAMGINIDRVFTGVFVLGAMLAGLAGAIGAGMLSLSPDTGIEILLFAMVVVIIGGLGSIKGAVVGAVAIGLIDAFARVWIPEVSYFTIFAPMALVLVLRPTGLYGKAA